MAGVAPVDPPIGDVEGIGGMGGIVPAAVATLSAARRMACDARLIAASACSSVSIVAGADGAASTRGRGVGGGVVLAGSLAG